MIDATQTALATRCLWALQESAPEIGALVLARTNGLLMTSTLASLDSAQRLAALSATLFLLSEHATESWGRGQAVETRLRISSEDAATFHYVIILPVGEEAVLLTLYESNSFIVSVMRNMELAIGYLAEVLAGEENLPPLRWHPR